MPDPTLDAAYRDTDYRVEDGPLGPFVIRIGEVSIPVERVLARHGQSEWAFITACNPGSERLSFGDNHSRMVELAHAILEWPHYPGISVGPAGDWAEPSFLVVGLSEGEAVELARHFGQNAVVAGRVGEPARLVWVA
jgi:hypothetical protein